MSTSLPALLQLAPTTQIIAFDSSTQTKSYRIELADGRHFQINEMLFQLLDCLKTPMSLTTLLETFRNKTDVSMTATTGSATVISADEIEKIGSQLLTQGILIQSGERANQTKHSQQNGSLLTLHYQRDLFSAQTLAPLVRPFQIFFTRTVALLITLLVAVAHIFAYAQIGLPPQLDMTTIQWPLFYVVILVSILLHELGHLAACQRWQCPHGPLGIGFYFFNPIFYVDVTAAWRLNRWQRAVVDIGGIYLQLACSIPFLLIFWLTKDATWLLAIVALDFFAIANLEPFMKLDGYWLLSDLTGVPNLHARTGEIIKQGLQRGLRLVGMRSQPAAPSPFSQWPARIRWIITLYVALSVVIWPLLILSMIPLVIQTIITYPALWQTTLLSLPSSLRQGELGTLFQQLQTLFLPTLMLLNVAVMIKMLVKRGKQQGV